MALANRTRVGLVNCVTGEFVQVGTTPFVIGCGEDCDLKLDDDSLLDQHCLVEVSKKAVQLRSVQPEHPRGGLLIDGRPMTVVTIKPRAEHALQIGKSFLIVGTSPKASPDAMQRWGMGIAGGGWIINKSNPAAATRPLALPEVFGALQAMQLDPESTPVFKGSAHVGFSARQLLALNGAQPAATAGEPDELPVAEPVGETTARGAGAAAQAGKFVDTEHGDFVCPTCWLRFDRGDVMHVAVHESLFGDPLLGEDHMLRFEATRFNDRGQALDGRGIPCTEIACPHCRRTLPPGYFDQPHRIFSIVGAPQSGKSYYLTVLIKLLQTTLYKKFGIVFRDSDPAGNAPLNEMKSHLFSAQSPSAAYLTKTQLEGEMYERLPRYDRMVTLPRPFVFSLSRSGDEEGDSCSIVFYDNAGEHFQPGQDSASSPGAQHIASSDAIFFLFDPTINPEFRRRLSDGDDPQLATPVSDQQDVILAETEVRIKKLLGLGRGERVSTPLAVIVGKCDSWIDQIGSEKFRDPISDGTVDLDAVDANSNLVRTLMEEICPFIVANAETISSDVAYFAASAFGHTPVSFEDEKGVQRIGPDPSRIAPMFIEAPTLWALSKLQPGLVPSFR